MVAIIDFIFFSETDTGSAKVLKCISCELMFFVYRFLTVPNSTTV